MTTTLAAPTAFAATRLSGVLVGFVTALVLIRNLTLEGYGALAAALAIGGVVFAAGPAGIDQLYLARRLPRGALPVLLPRLSAAYLLLAGVAAAFWPGLATETRLLVLLVGAAMALDLARNEWLLVPQLGGSFLVRARRELVMRLLVAAGLVAGALIWRTPLAAVLGSLAVNAALAAYVWGSWRRKHGEPREPHIHNARKWLRRGLPYTSSGLLFTLTVWTPTAVMGSLASEEQTAHYRAVFTFVIAAVTLAAAFNNEVFRPIVYGLGQGPASRDISAVAARYLLLNVAAGGAAAMGTYIVTAHALAPIFGGGYAPAAALAPLISAAVAVHFFNSWASNLLLAVHALRPVLTTQLLGVAVCLGVAVVSIPSLGAHGAARAALTAESAVAMAYAVALAARRTGRP